MVFALESSRSTNFPSQPEVKKNTIRKTFKSYIDPLKIKKLLPILYEQFKFRIPQHWRAVITWELIGSQVRLQFRIPRIKLSPPIKLRVIRPQMSEKLFFQYQVLIDLSWKNPIFIYNIQSKKPPKHFSHGTRINYTALLFVLNPILTT